MIGAIIGDVVGSRFEFNNILSKEFEFFHPNCEFTDDTVMTCAVAQGLMDSREDYSDLSEKTVLAMQRIGRQFPYCGYGARFINWMFSDNPQPYNSCGNGSAMRCSSAGWLATSEDECIELATKTAAPTHNHEEGIKGAVVTALTIFHLKNGKDKDFVQNEILAKYYPYWADKTYKDIHDGFQFNSTSPGTVGPAILSFLASENYIDCVKLAISLGGDADTLAAIAGPMAYAFYKEMPEPLVYQVFKHLPDWMQNVNEEFDNRCNGKWQNVLSVDNQQLPR